MRRFVPSGSTPSLALRAAWNFATDRHERDEVHAGGAAELIPYWVGGPREWGVGFDNKTLTTLMAGQLDTPYTSRQATYDLRRLRRKDLIERLPHSNRYQLTTLGRRVAVIFTRAHNRVLAPGLTALDPALPADIGQRHPLATAWRTLNHELDRFVTNGLAAA